MTRCKTTVASIPDVTFVDEYSFVKYFDQLLFRELCWSGGVVLCQSPLCLNINNHKRMHLVVQLKA
jgi:hypothetical protein